MMKKEKIISSTLLALITSITLIACNNAENNGPTITGKPVEEPEVHYVEGMLHEINVTESNTPFIVNGETEYSVVFEKDSKWGNKAALFIQRQINRALGVVINIIEYDGNNFSYTPSSKIICIDVKDILDDAGIEMTNKPIGNAGYHLLTKNDSVFIQCNSGYGYANGVRMFLKQTIGYEIYSAEIIVYNKDGSTLPNMDIYEAPDMTYKFQSNKADSNANYEMGFLSWGEAFFNKQIAGKTIPTQHNVLTWLPKDTYLDEINHPDTYHPKWYNATSTQICWSAHGDEAEYNLLVDTLFDKFKQALIVDPDVGTICFTQEDRPELCTCDGCRHLIEQYGSDSGIMVRLLNDVDVKLQDWLEDIAEENNTIKREVNLVFFAYQNSERPCVHLDENGVYQPNHPDVICREHVVPYIAPIFANYEESFYNEKNKSVQETIDGWKALSKYAYFWIYETNFSHYIYPYNSFSTMLDTYRYIISSGAQFIFNEGQHDNDATTAFGRFKEYFNYVALNNVNTDYQVIVDDFFTNYFREAKDIMLKMFYEIQEYYKYLISAYPTELDGRIYEDPAQPKMWPINILQRWENYCEEALTLIEKHKSTNLSLYNSLYKNIVLESIFPQYVILELHRGKFSSSQINERVKKLLADCQLTKISRYGEGKPLIPAINAWISE